MWECYFLHLQLSICKIKFFYENKKKKRSKTTSLINFYKKYHLDFVVLFFHRETIAVRCKNNSSNDKYGFCYFYF